MSVGLYDFQLEAISKMHNGCILCGGVGTGKSRTALGYYFKENGGSLTSADYIPMYDPPQDLYIITTARKRDTLEWDGDMVPFLMSRDSKVSLYSNYVVVDSWNNIEKYKDITQSFFIFDEQRVVGYGKWSKTFIHISKNNNWILLSATPGDQWIDYIPVFIANGFYKNKTEFIHEHVMYSRFTKYPKIDRYMGVYKLNKLRDSLLVDISIQRHTDRHHIYVRHTYDIKKYRQALRDRWDPFKNEPVSNPSSMCYILRKIVNTDEAKQVELLQIMEKTPRAIIFYNFNYELEILKNLDYGDDYVIAEWNGRVHQEIPDSNKWVYLVQYTAGCEGWNCIKTNTIIFFSPNYSYKVMEQASGRIDRLNTTYHDLFYYHLQSNSSIDLAIKRALDTKKEFNKRKFTKWSNDFTNKLIVQEDKLAEKENKKNEKDKF